ncbi:MAG: phosphate signaling complex protein PhoU [Chloroflexi bacterium]|nr:phosphate signaling complex protein PhoU [Chloroflexota bacterium]
MDTRSIFHNSLIKMQDDVLSMASMVEKAINRSMYALKNRDIESAQIVINDDTKINEKRLNLEETCVKLIATQQPMASDLRMLISMLAITWELERIGDHAEGIAKITIMNGNEPHIKPLIDLPKMTLITEEMLRQSMDALVARDEKAAMQIALRDDDVDKLYDVVFGDLIGYMARDPKTIPGATRLLWVAHNLERSADRVTNICERVVFLVTGKMMEIGASKY